MPNQNNADLEQEYKDFVYAVSHDFSAPLRHIKNFSHFLIEARENPTEEELEYIGFIKESLNNLDKMQEALLILSRLKTDPENWNDVDCGAMVSEIMVDLSGHYDVSTYDINIENLPVIKTDENLMKVVLTALIDNALKFHDSSSKNKTVIISATQSGGCTQIDITDNGIGVNEDQDKNIFKIFKRLQPDMYDGTGAGLTVAQKAARLINAEVKPSKSSQGHQKFSILIS